MNYYFKKDKGFTLVELILYVVIAGVVLLVISIFFMNLVTSRIKNETVSEVEFQGTQVLQMITQNIRNAEEVSSPIKGETSSSLAIIKEGENITFGLDDGVIYIQEASGDPVNLTNKRVLASSLLFENVGKENAPESIRISFTLSRVNHTGRSEYSFVKSFLGSSSLRTTIAEEEEEEEVIDNCHDYCISIGYSEGVCRQNSNRCDSNDEIHETDGDGFCPGTGGQNVCCCN